MANQSDLYSTRLCVRRIPTGLGFAWCSQVQTLSGGWVCNLMVRPSLTTERVSDAEDVKPCWPAFRAIAPVCI